MNYVVLDLEWNQPRIGEKMVDTPFRFDSEIVEIGAVKLDEKFEEIGEFRAYVKPVFYPVMNGKVARLTKITQHALETERCFADVYKDFVQWCGDDYGFMTWSMSDLPVLMDNIIIHQLPMDISPICYDIQRVFGREIMRDEKQWSLEKIMELLKIPADVAHDALHDAKNTVRACQYLNLKEYLEEYRTAFVGYAQDRLSGIVDGIEFDSLSEAIKEEKIISTVCPYTGERIEGLDWTLSSKAKIFGYGRSSEGDEYLFVLKKELAPKGRIRVSRKVFEMSDDQWDCYQQALEKAEKE